MCFASTSEFAPRSSKLRSISWAIFTRMLEFEANHGNPPIEYYKGGCYAIARAMQSLSGYELRIVGLQEPGWELTPHVVCVSPTGHIIDAKARQMTNRIANASARDLPAAFEGNVQYMATPRKSGCFPPSRNRSDYKFNVTARDFSTNVHNFGSSHRETYYNLKHAVDTNAYVPHMSAMLAYISA